MFWGKLAETVTTYCGQKGDMISVSGKIQTRSFDNKEGKKVYVTEVVAEDMQFLNGKRAASGQGVEPSAEDWEGMTPINDGEIPF